MPTPVPYFASGLPKGVNPGSLLGWPTGRTARTEARQAATRERIAAAAHDQVAEGGYASASVQAVAARAGVAVGTVYRHFPSKAELFAEVFRRASERELAVVAERRPATARGPPTERVGAGAEAFCRRALAGPALAYALLAEPVDPAVEGERLRLRRGYRDVFASVLRRRRRLRRAARRTTPPRWPPPWSARSARRSWARWPPAPTAATTRLMATPRRASASRACPRPKEHSA